jgi:hypothetical protein
MEPLEENLSMMAPCPCGSGLTFRSCHGEFLLAPARDVADYAARRIRDAILILGEHNVADELARLRRLRDDPVHTRAVQTHTLPFDAISNIASTMQGITITVDSIASFHPSPPPPKPTCRGVAKRRARERAKEKQARKARKVGR